MGKEIWLLVVVPVLIAAGVFFFKTVEPSYPVPEFSIPVEVQEAILDVARQNEAIVQASMTMVKSPMAPPPEVLYQSLPQVVAGDKMSWKGAVYLHFTISELEALDEAMNGALAAAASIPGLISPHYWAYQSGPDFLKEYRLFIELKTPDGKVIVSAFQALDYIIWRHMNTRYVRYSSIPPGSTWITHQVRHPDVHMGFLMVDVRPQWLPGQDPALRPWDPYTFTR